MNNIENRIVKLENQLGTNQPVETLEQMINKFEKGGYGEKMIFETTRHAMYGGSYDHWKGRLPDPLITWIRKSLEKIPGFNECRAKYLETVKS